MNSSKDKDSQSEEVSENDISDFTNNHVFRGGLGLLQPNNQSKPPLMITSNNNPQIQHPILQSLARPEGNITIPNSSLYSSGFLSFRNKKANILNPQGLNCSNNKIEENVDPAAVTQSILEKLNSFKESSHNMIMSIENTTPGRKDKYNNEQKEIGKLFKNNNNDSKPIEEECETKDINYLHTNSSNKDSMKLNGSIGDNESNHSEEDTSNLFWNLTRPNGNEDDENRIDSQKKEKYINTIICTLSLLEKGKAIFVSQDDMIFVLPSIFVPKNLVVGNTYMFIVGEYENYSQKTQTIKDIQKEYVNTNNS